MSEGLNYISHHIKGKDIFLSAMKIWDLPAKESDEDKVARIKLEGSFKTRIVVDEKHDPISQKIEIKYFVGNSYDVFPKALGQEVLFLDGLSLSFWNFFDTKYNVYFNEDRERNLTRLFAHRMNRKAVTMEIYLLRTTMGDPLKLHEVWQKFKDGINTKAKDLW